MSADLGYRLAITNHVHQQVDGDLSSARPDIYQRVLGLVDEYQLSALSSALKEGSLQLRIADAGLHLRGPLLAYQVAANDASGMGKTEAKILFTVEGHPSQEALNDVSLLTGALLAGSRKHRQATTRLKAHGHDFGVGFSNLDELVRALNALTPGQENKLPSSKSVAC